jgi:LPS export ABC transporter protein LptC
MIEFFMKKILLIGLSFLLLAGIFLMTRSGKEMNGELQFIGGSFIEDMKIVQTKKGVTLWTLTANRANFLEGEDRAELKDISLTIPQNSVVLHADKGIYNLSERSFITDSIVKAEAKDYRITADSVDFDISSGDIRAEGRIHVEGKGFRIEGKGMSADGDQKVKIFDDVKATFEK